MKTQFAAIALGVSLAVAGLAPALAADLANGGTDMSAQSSQHPVDDTWITTKVKAELIKTPGIRSGDIDVTTKNGLVTLSGTVNSKAQLQKAIALTKSVRGVKQVDSTALSSRD